MVKGPRVAMGVASRQPAERKRKEQAGAKAKKARRREKDQKEAGMLGVLRTKTSPQKQSLQGRKGPEPALEGRPSLADITSH